MVTPPPAADFKPEATREDILACFRLLLGRYPDDIEWEGHSALAGAPLQDLVAAYINSLEFRKRGLINSSGGLELIDLKRFRMYTTPGDPLIGNAIRTTGVYEPDVAQVFLDRLRPAAHVLDIGANIGYFSLLGSSLVGPAGRVYAFEPLAGNVRVLMANCVLNQFTNIEILAAAASDRAKTAAIGNSFTDGMVGEVPQSVEATLACEFVFSVRVDEVIRTKIDLLKIDVEGHEYRAITGATETIRRSHPVIISEFSPAALEVNSGVSPSSYLDLLRSLGYRVSALGRPDIETNQAILQVTRGLHHIDILADPV